MGEKGGGERLPCRLFLWFRGKAAADLTLRMLLARLWLRPMPLLCQPSPDLVGLRCPSLGALMLIGGFRELALVGMGNGGSRGSGRLGLLLRPAWVAMPLWIMAALRMPLDLLDVLRTGPFSSDLRAPFSEDFRVTDSRLSRPSGSAYLAYVSVPPSGRMELRPELCRGKTGCCSGEVVPAPPEPRLPERLGLGAESAVLNSESLMSASANSSASSELAPSNPANKLLMRCGRLIGAF